MSRVTIIAEAGVNHNGDVARAKEMVWAAKEAGADLVKFQAFTTETIVSTQAPTAAYQATNTGIKSQFELIKALELSRKDFAALAAECRKAGIAFLATPFDWTMTEELVGLGMPALKVASGEITNTPALVHFATYKLPIWLSTGMATLDEVATALATLKGAGSGPVTILQCTTQYPAPPEAMNLRAMVTMQQRFGCPVGLSDHSLGDHATIAAVALGATLIEKHFTLDRNLPGPDHLASLEPETFREMVARVREVEVMLGDGVKQPVAIEIETARLVRRSWHTRRALPKGRTLGEGDVVLMRPATGLQPDICPIGLRLVRDVAGNAPITADLVEPA